MLCRCAPGVVGVAPGSMAVPQKLYQSQLQRPLPAPMAPAEAQIEKGLARVEQRRQQPTGRDLAYVGFLNTLASCGILDRLPLDAAGVLQVCVPFCGGCSEVPLLLPFLKDGFVGLGRPAKGICMLGVDLEPSEIWWSTFREWSRRCLGPQVMLDFEAKDLCAEKLPPTGLILGIHPGPDLSPSHVNGPWRHVVTNILSSLAPGGRCVFACFYKHEVEGVKMICAGVGARVSVMENPFYLVSPMPTYTDHLGVTATPLRYIVVIDP
eukprot:TRINITY_DN68756_c0_g1_i1.p1 TRINITY_DN68756_c0_g1~~TRINITY_DN68756_c0_g1_i1.p1  ORF type:complete len:266 (-),score=48.82 TRINITY_DN68756_c0_g1_i1:79-876(-)